MEMRRCSREPFSKIVELQSSLLKEIRRDCIDLSPGVEVWRWLVDFVRLAVNYLYLCFQIRRERKILAKLMYRELQDIKISSNDAHVESRRSFFDVPVDRLYFNSVSNTAKKTTTSDMSPHVEA